MRRHVVIERLINATKMMGARYVAYRASRDTVKELSRLSDKDLNDIGLCRGDIHYIANKQFDEMLEDESARTAPLYRRMPKGILDI